MSLYITILMLLMGERWASTNCGRLDWREVGGGLSKLVGGRRFAPQTGGGWEVVTQNRGDWRLGSLPYHLIINTVHVS